MAQYGEQSVTSTRKGVPVILGSEQLREIARHGEATYPEECCGIVLGRETDGVRSIERLMPIDNQWDSVNRGERFLISSRDVLRAEREARRVELDVLGFYHSHPDSPARPSEFDREHAWPWYTYLIISIEAGRAGPLNAWQLRDDRSGYEAVPLSASAASVSR
jgi:proteasome lid subunit RPN8/RPN11